jgi:hypothetical protein
MLSLVAGKARAGPRSRGPRNPSCKSAAPIISNTAGSVRKAEALGAAVYFDRADRE